MPDDHEIGNRGANADVPEGVVPVEFSAALDGERGSAAADRLCSACVDLLDIDAAAISLVFSGTNAGTLGVSSPSARAYDEVQFTLGEGPCLDAVATRGPIVVVDLDDPGEWRWPVYAPAMLALDVRSVSAMPIIVAGEFIGALDLFRTDPGSLSPADFATAVVAAEMAEIPVLDLLSSDLAAASVDPHSGAWTEINALSRAEVSQATGVLVAQLGVSAGEALVRLRAHAYATGQSATEVARDILARRLRLDLDP